MNLDNLKTAFAKERHAELMIGAGGATLVAVMASILDPDTLKLLDTPEPILGKVLIWGAAILGGFYLIYKGLNRIDEERAAIKSQSDTAKPPTAASRTSNPLAIQIQHGNTLISINIQPEKIDAQ